MLLFSPWCEAECGFRDPVDTIRAKGHLCAYKAAPGDCASVSAADMKAGQIRPKAEGFPLAPLIEAVLAVQFDGGLSGDEAREASAALAGGYAAVSEVPERGVVYDADAESLQVQPPRIVYRLEGTDDTEVALVGPAGLAVSQLAPYKSWEQLAKRFMRDLSLLNSSLGGRPVVRLGARFINRIDVPLVNGAASHEDYLALHIHLPADVPAISDFYLRFTLGVPEIGGTATIQSAVMPPAVEGKASFALDIDMTRSGGLPEGSSDVLALLDQFRSSKNRLYKQFLTEEALREFV